MPEQHKMAAPTRQEILWLACAAGIALIVLPPAANPSEHPKILALRALSILLGVATLLARSREPAGTPFLRLALAGCAVSLCAITAFSPTPNQSLWGSYERGQGLVTQLSYLTLFVCTVAGLRSRPQIHRLWTCICLGSLPVVVIGIAQALGMDPIGLHTDANSQVMATLGRSNFLGSYLVLLIPLTLSSAVTAQSRYRRLAATALVVGQTAALILTLTRAAWLGLLGGMLIATALLAIISRNRRLLSLTMIPVVGLAALGALMLIPTGLSAHLGAGPLATHVRALADLQSGATAARLAIWRTAAELCTERPLLGYGLDTMRATFTRVYPPELVYYQGRTLAVDRAHNLWLDIAFSGGLLGMLSFLALVAAIASLAYGGVSRAATREGRWHWWALVAALAGHLIDLQASFETTATATITWLLLALMVALERQDRQPTELIARKPRVSKRIRGLAWLAALALVGTIVVRPLVAGIEAARAQSTTLTAESRLADAQQAVRWWPFEPVHWCTLAHTYAENGDLAGAQWALDRAGDLHPDDPAHLAFQGDLYAQHAPVTPNSLAQAISAYQLASDLAPTVAGYHTALGVTFARVGDLDGSQRALGRAVSLDTTDFVAYSCLAWVYRAAGRLESGEWAEAQAVFWAEQQGTATSVVSATTVPP